MAHAPGLRERLALPTPLGRRGRVAHLAGVAVLIGLLAWAVRDLDLRAVGEVLMAAHPGWVAAAMLANVLSLLAHSGRWASVVAPAGRTVRYRDAFGALTAGFAVGAVLPARAGDLVRAHLLARRTGLSTAATLAASGVDYVVGAAAILPLLALLAEVSPLPGWARHAAGAMAAAAGAGAVAAFALARRGRSHGDGASPGRLRARWETLRTGLSAAREPGPLLRALGFALAGWAAEVLIAWCALQAVGLASGWDGVVAAGLAVVATTAANVVAVSPGNAGPFELATVVALAGAGVEREPALAFALLYHLVHLVPVGVLGSAWLLSAGRQETAGG